MAISKEAYFEGEAARGISHGFQGMIINGRVSDQVIKALETDDFDSVDFVEPDLRAPYTLHSENQTPVVAAAMDSVTRAEAAIVVAEGGGRGALDYGMTAKEQFGELETVKKRLNGRIDKPKTVTPGQSMHRVHELMEKHPTFSSYPVVTRENRLVGLISNRQTRRSLSPTERVSKRMQPVEQLLVSDRVDLDITEAYRIMRDDEQQRDKLMIVDNDLQFRAMFTFTDALRVVVHNSGIRNVDANQRYVCDVAVPTREQAFRRLELCAPYLVDGGGVIILDTANGEGFHSFKFLRALKRAYPDIDIMAGNVTDPAAAVLLAKAGADGIKVGHSSGGQCITYEQTGAGKGQLTAVWEVIMALREAGFGHLPVCSDGGVKFHKDPAIAIAAGASSVMVGTKLGAANESPGRRRVNEDGAIEIEIRGMGSPPALIEGDANGARYDVAGIPLPEGEFHWVPIRGPLAPIYHDFRRALRKSMIYAGAVSIADFQERTTFEYDPARAA